MPEENIFKSRPQASLATGPKACFVKKARGAMTTSAAKAHPFPLAAFSNLNGHAQEGCRNGRGILVRAFVLAGEQSFQFLLEISCATVLFRRVERIHGRPVVFSEFIHERGGRAGIVERERFPAEGDLFFGNSRAGESFDHMALDTPRHRADEAFRRWRRVGGADLQDLRDQRRVAGNPVPHDDASAGPGHAHHLLGHIMRLGRKHRAKDAHDEIKRLDLPARADWSHRLPETGSS